MGLKYIYSSLLMFLPFFLLLSFPSTDIASHPTPNPHQPPFLLLLHTTTPSLYSSPLRGSCTSTVVAVCVGHLESIMNGPLLTADIGGPW